MSTPTIEPRRSSQPEPLRLDPEGNWFQGEYPILHERTIKYLQKHIVVTEEGDYFFEGEDKPIPIIVEDVPFWVVKVEKTIAGFLITLTDESIELLDPESLWVMKDSILYCRVKGSLAARFQRNPYNEITRALEQKGGRFYLNIGKKSYLIANKAPADWEKMRTAKKNAAAKKEKKKEKKAAAKKKAKAAIQKAPAKAAKKIKKSSKKPTKKAKK